MSANRPSYGMLQSPRTAASGCEVVIRAFSSDDCEGGKPGILIPSKGILTLKTNSVQVWWASNLTPRWRAVGHATFWFCGGSVARDRVDDACGAPQRKTANALAGRRIVLRFLAPHPTNLARSPLRLRCNRGRSALIKRASGGIGISLNMTCGYNVRI